MAYIRARPQLNMIPEGVIYARASTPTYPTYPVESLPSCSFAQPHHDLTSHGAMPELGTGRERDGERERERETQASADLTMP